MIRLDSGGQQLEAWRVPPLGSVADEDLPAWLVSKLSDGSVEIHALGGLGNFEAEGLSYCLPGDIIVRHHDGQLSFCAETTFDDIYPSVN